MKLNREKLEELLNDVMGFVKDSIATNNRNAESIHDLVEINRMLKNECTQEYNEKVRYKKAWQRAIFDKRLLQEELQKNNEAYNEKLQDEGTTEH